MSEFLWLKKLDTFSDTLLHPLLRFLSKFTIDRYVTNFTLHKTVTKSSFV